MILAYKWWINVLDIQLYPYMIYFE